ncbi:hypothetical protein ACHQM5_005540 [Ranunculus cassubicifolius]
MSHTTTSLLSSLLRNQSPFHSIHQIKQTHLQLLINNFLPNITLQTDLLLAYSKHNHLKDARQVFDEMPERNMHSWNILISSYVQNSLFHESLRVFRRFLEMGLRPDHFTFPSVFKACGGVSGFEYVGCSLHGWTIKLGFSDQVIVGCSILDFYGKCGNLSDAYMLFVEMPDRDTVVWNSMISGLVRGGYCVEAMSCLREMLVKGRKMDSRTIPSILSACGREGYLMSGREIHGKVVKSVEYSGDVAIGNALIEMYGKCGSVDVSRNVFKNMPRCNVITWTSLISCYGAHGKGEESLLLFEKMRSCGVLPNSVTFTAVLASCSHSGLIDQGRKIFDMMSSEYGIEPSIEHYACMVDLLGRSGSLEEALELLKNMRQEAPPSVWGALLGACGIHENVAIGEIAACRLFELEMKNPSNYIALCRIYESVGKGDEISRIRSRMKELGIVKKPGCSWISIKGKVRSFYQGDVSHAQTKIVSETLDEMARTLMLPHGYG